MENNIPKKTISKTFYLYIDDSGKFHNNKDSHVIYSYILLDKRTRDKFNEKFVNASLPLRSVGKQIKSKKYIKKDLLYWQSWLPEKDKGDSFFRKYKYAIKRNNAALINRYDNFFTIFSNYCLDFGSVSWCKKTFNPKFFVEKSKDNAEKNLQKKKFMILTIIKKLIDSGKIKKDSDLKIYIDIETDDCIDCDLKASIVRNYLMQKPDPPFVRVNGMIYSIWANNINISIEYLESNVSFPIQASDILANATYKILSTQNELKNFWPYFTNNNIKFLSKSLFSFQILNLTNFIPNSSSNCC